MLLLCSSHLSLDCYPQSSLEDAVFPFGLFQSKFVQVSYITLSLGSFSPPFTSDLTDLIQAVNCLCGCIVPSPQSENRRGEDDLEDLCADPGICFNQSSPVSPHLQSIPAFPVTTAIAVRPSMCMSLNLNMALDSQVTAILMHASPTPHRSSLAPFSFTDTVFPSWWEWSQDSSVYAECWFQGDPFPSPEEISGGAGALQTWPLMQQIL